MAKITPSLSTRKDGRGKSEILLRFVAGRGHIYRLHSNIYINPARWKDGAVVIPRLATSEQAELKAVKARLDALCDYLIERFVEADKTMVSRAYMQRTVDTFYHPRDTGTGGELSNLLEEYIHSKDVSDWRMKRYRVVCAAVHRFESVRGKHLELTDVNAQLLQELDRFLVNEHEIARRPENRHVYGRMTLKELPKQRSRNTLLDYTNILRAFFVWARGAGYTDNDPFMGIASGTARYGTPYYISIEERNRIYRTNLSRHPALAAQRDIFVFQCLVGCRVGDLLRLRKEDVVDGVLVYIPHKTVTTHPQTLRIP
ncbi:MAG: phage integrase SAM-like domain-containing protein, partial [Treponema sp.]|nr:phage integrase SAM-like domain-containing protein [Treponema sp.]